jgi:hypothetical protein
MSTYPKHNAVAITAAPIPSTFVQDPLQLSVFGNPARYEQHFQVLPGNQQNISPDYILRVNSMLRQINNTCHITGARERQLTVANDVIEIEFLVTNTELILSFVNIRPCFMKRKLFQILMLQLLRSASMTNKRLIISSCFPATLAILQHFFKANLMTVEPPDQWVAHPTCIFHDFAAMMRITPEYLRIPHGMVTIGQNGLVQLQVHAFPTSAQLNDQHYVDTYYATPTH